MNVIYLGPPSPLVDWLQSAEEAIIRFEGKVSLSDVNGFDFIVSYGYRHIVKPDILARFQNRAVNLHIGYLPWNRGADPNLWSWATDTPKGVTVHYMDAGIDTGDIIAQAGLVFSAEGETLRTTYDLLQILVQKLFMQYWPDIKAGTCPKTKQPRGGTYHTKRDRRILQHLLLEKGWDTPVSVLDEYAGELQAAVGWFDKQKDEIAAIGYDDAIKY